MPAKPAGAPKKTVGLRPPTSPRQRLNVASGVGRSAIRRTVARLQHMARTYDITLDALTKDTIDLVLSGRPSPTTVGTTAT